MHHLTVTGTHDYANTQVAFSLFAVSELHTTAKTDSITSLISRDRGWVSSHSSGILVRKSLVCLTGRSWKHEETRQLEESQLKSHGLSTSLLLGGWIKMCYCQSAETSGLRHWADWTHCAETEWLKYQKIFWNICRYVGTQVQFPSHWGYRVSVRGGNCQWIYQHFRVSCLSVLILVLNITKQGSYTFHSDILMWLCCLKCNSTI